MMELPDSIYVDRDDLRSESSISSAPPATLGTNYLDQLAKEFGNIEDASLPPRQSEAATEANGGDLEFRLFASGDAGKAQRISLRSPTPPNPTSGLFVTRRPQTYYFAGEATRQQFEEYRSVAITGEEVRRELARRWKGCEVPWRVSIINTTSVTKSTAKQITDTVPGGKRCRRGKKTRISIRRRVAKQEAAKTEKKQNEALKEAAEKEKRNARNREKKVKRRQKQRDAKAATKDSG